MRPLAVYAAAVGRRGVLFPKPDGGPWLDHDFRNWRRRVFRPAAEACGFDSLRPYDLHHSFASLLIHEGRPLMEIADQLGHSVETLLRHYAHLIAEMAGQPPSPAERAILAACARVGMEAEASRHGPPLYVNPPQRKRPQNAFDGGTVRPQNAPRDATSRTAPPN